MIPDLYLMRHGETVWNVEGRLQGRRDSPLTPLGIGQAASLALMMRNVVGARVTSPLGRADQTARIVFGTNYCHDARLVEICVGDFTGCLTRDLHRDHPETFAGGGLDWYDQCANGEGFHALEVRCRAFLNDLTGPALIVTHGITLRMLRCLALGRSTAELGQGMIHQGGVHVIRAGQEMVLLPPESPQAPNQDLPIAPRPVLYPPGVAR